jgi:hypothetical protein
LQIDARKHDLVQHSCEALVRDLSPWVSDVVDTLSTLQHLDMVITCESALAHMSGAIGLETWIPYAYHAHDYRLGHDGSAMLWYGKTHRLFKQGRDFRWQPVFEDIAKALQEKVDGLAKQAGKVGERNGPRKVAIRQS